MIRGHLLSLLGGVAVSLLNLVGIVVLFGALRHVFSAPSHSALIVLLTAVGLRIGFCVLVVRITDKSDSKKWFCATGIIAISSTPILCTPGNLSMLVTFQIGLDLLIVLLIVVIRSRARLDDCLNENVASQFEPGQSIYLRRFLEYYGVEELGSLFIYLPKPSKPTDANAEAFTKILKEKEVVQDPYRVYATSATIAARASLPHLFDRSPLLFEVYRVDRNRLEDMFTG